MALALLVTGALACDRIRGDALVILGEGGSAVVTGKVSFELNPSTGQFEPDLWKPGMLYLFRADQEVGDTSGKAGEVYRVTKDRSLERAGTFDVGSSDQELKNRFLVGSE